MIDRQEQDEVIRSNLPTLSRRLALAAGFCLAAATSGCGTKQESQSNEPEIGTSESDLGTIVCGTYPGFDGEGNRVDLPEYYVVHSMNRRLRAFPDFAAAAGMKLVRTCDEARAFDRVYDDYFNAHPNFDKDLTNEKPFYRPPMRSDLPSEITGDKVFNGMRTGPAATADRFPVVRIMPF
jgi:hypothetical protein